MKPPASYVAKILKRIELRGNSMAPSFNEGDWLLFYTGPGQRRGSGLIGKIVLIAKSPELLIVKRVLRINGSSKKSGATTYWVEGDNKSGSTDSRNWGEVSDKEIVGLLLFRYHRSDKN